MVNWFLLCCGEGIEEEKFGSFVDPVMAKELGWMDDTENESERPYPNLDKQLSILLEARREAVDDISTGSSTHLDDSVPQPELRATICGRPFDYDPDYIVPVHEKTKEDELFLEEALQKNFVFAELDADELHKLIGSMKREIVSTGTKVVVQGAVGEFFYVVESGTIRFLKNTENVGECEAGGSFGELALLHDTPRSVSCVAMEPCVLWRTHRTAFQYTLAHHSQYQIVDASKALRNVTLFNDMDDKTISRFSKALAPLTWKAGTRIVHKGEGGSVFHIIQKGRVQQTDLGMGDSDTADIEMGPGDWFGDQSLLAKEPSYANVTAITDVVTLAMDRETFQRCVGPFEALLLRTLREKRLLAMPIFANSLSKPEISNLADLIMEVCYPKGATIAKAGEPSEMKLWMIRRGKLLVYSEEKDELYSLEAGDFFGDDSIKADGEYISKHTVVCEENLTVWILTRDQIESIAGDTDRLGDVEAFSKTKVKRQFALADLTKHRMIGRGGFGKVWVVSYEDEGNKEYFALKTINKANVLDADLHKAVLREKELLCVLDHPFISSLIASYQDETNLYLVMPLLLGGELFDALRKRKTKGRGLPARECAFYCAGVIEALGYFHRREIAYRDLKLENVMIDDEGYPKIVDLGFAKVVTQKTFTLCGTLEYLAPEIIIAKGHDISVDYWAFGILLFELLAGKSPFFVAKSSQIDTFKRIIKMEYTMPTFFSENAQDLVRRLLVRRPTERLGSLATGHLGVQRHEWFAECGIKFKALLAKRIKAPWKPEIGDIESVGEPDSGYENTRALSRSEQELFVGF